MAGLSSAAASRAYRRGRLAMRGGVLVALFAVLALPPGEPAMALFALAVAVIGWGAWTRRRYCPARRADAIPPGEERTTRR